MKKLLTSNGKALVDNTGKVLTFESDVTITKDNESIGLSGDYDGSPIEITEAGKVDIKALIDEKKIPLEVNVNVASSGGVVVVDELPTENIQEGVIYQVNEISDIDVLGWLGEPYIPVNLEQFIINFGATPTLIYEIVDSLPSTPNVSNLQTFSPAYVYIQNDIPYVYGNAGYGNMWLDVVTLFNNLAGTNLENKGYVTNTDEILETGLYVTYKNVGKQGIVCKEHYKAMVYQGGWNDYQGIIDGTITEYSSNTKNVRGYGFYYHPELTTVNLPNLQTVHIYTFCNCAKLVNVNIPQATYINTRAFEACTSLTNIDLPEVKTISSNGFNYCTKLTTINLPNLVHISNGAFDDCLSLKDIDLPKVTSIGTGAFSNSKLSTIRLGANEVCTLNGEAFAGTIISKIYVPDELVEDYKVATNWSKYAAIIKPISEYVEE